MTVSIPYQTIGALVCLGVGLASGFAFFVFGLFRLKPPLRFIADLFLTLGSFALLLYCLQTTQNGDVKFYHVAVAAIGLLSALIPLKKLSDKLKSKNLFKKKNENLTSPSID